MSYMLLSKEMYKGGSESRVTVSRATGVNGLIQRPKGDITMPAKGLEPTTLWPTSRARCHNTGET